MRGSLLGWIAFAVTVSTASAGVPGTGSPGGHKIAPAGGALRTVSAEPGTRALLDKARAMGSIRVIASLNISPGDLATLSEAEMSAYTANLRETQDGVIERVLGGDRSGVTILEFTPALALSVTPDQLEMLLADPAVSRVQEDGLAAPSEMQGGSGLTSPGQ